MSAREATLDPVGSSDDAFFDALVGLDRVCRYVAQLIDGPVGGPDAVNEPARRTSDETLDETPDEVLDAVLGLWSVRTTVALVLDALRGEITDAEPAAEAAWSRELLR